MRCRAPPRPTRTARSASSPDEALSAPVLAELPFSPELQGTPTPGDPHPALEGLARTVVDAADTAWDLDLPADAVDIRGEEPDGRKRRVREAFTSLESGETFTLVSDRDPTPVREFLATVADVEPGDIEEFSVERRTPDDWVLTASRP